MVFIVVAAVGKRIGSLTGNFQTRVVQSRREETRSWNARTVIHAHARPLTRSPEAFALTRSKNRGQRAIRSRNKLFTGQDLSSWLGSGVINYAVEGLSLCA